MAKVKNTIPLVDICSLADKGPINNLVIAEPFAEYLKVHPNLRLPHRHSFYHFVLFTKGAGYHTVDFRKFTVSPGHMYFMAPGQVHSWNFEGEVDGYVVNFSPVLFHGFLVNTQFLDSLPFFQGIADDSVTNLHGKTLAEVRHILAQVVVEVHIYRSQALDIVRSYLLQMLLSVSRDFAVAEAPALRGGVALLQKFRKLIDEWYAEKRLPKDYAALLYITPNHLNALCNDVLGRSAGGVIRDRVLLEAKRLLVNADVNITEIATRLNFTDGSHFTRFFKKYTGVTPEEFRKSTLTTINH